MKKLFLLIVLLTSTISYSQMYSDAIYEVELSNGECYSLETNKYIYRHIEEFFNIAKENNVNIDRVKSLKGVYFCSFSRTLPASLHPNFGLNTGFRDFNKQYILVNADLIPPYIPTFLNAVIYHEFYHHLLDTPHHVIDTPYVLREGSRNNPEHLIRIWDDFSKKEYFSYIKRNQKVSKFSCVTATVYHAVPEQTNSDPKHTASMFEIDLTNPYGHRILAVSRDLLKEYPYGSLVKVAGTSYDGIYRVEDTMNIRFTKRIDILINRDMNIGKWTNVKITKL